MHRNNAFSHGVAAAQNSLIVRHVYLAFTTTSVEQRKWHGVHIQCIPLPCVTVRCDHLRILIRRSPSALFNSFVLEIRENIMHILHIVTKMTTSFVQFLTFSVIGNPFIRLFVRV